MADVMADFEFLRPWWLLAGIAAIVLWWVLRGLQRRLGAWESLMDPHLLEELAVGETGRRRTSPLGVVVVLWIVASVALAGPAWRDAPTPFAEEDAGLMVLLKVSETMLATDVQPSRLARATHKLTDLLELRDGSSTGLIAYSGSAHLVMPLTRDGDIVRTMAAELSPGLMPTDGDDLDSALALAAEYLQRSGVPGSILVIADSVAAGQGSPADSFDVPVQFLSIQRSGAAVNDGLARAAAAYGAPVAGMTIDTGDVERIAGRAASRIRDVDSAAAGARRQDAGYFLLPLIALLAIPWARRGWLVS